MTPAWLLLELGELTGKRYELTVSICPNPVCECEIVSLRCMPLAAEDQTRSGSAAVCLEMDVDSKRIANLEELGRNPVAAAVARAVSSEMTESDWNRLRSLYFGAKQRFTETTALDQIDAQFPGDRIAQGMMVGYYEVLPYAAPVEVSWKGRSWLFDGQSHISVLSSRGGLRSCLTNGSGFLWEFSRSSKNRGHFNRCTTKRYTTRKRPTMISRISGSSFSGTMRPDCGK